jgi:ribonuclease P protein component
VLPRLLRMRNSKDFRRTTSRGIRVSRPTLVVHAVQLPDGVVSDTVGVVSDTVDAARSGPRIGFVVSGALGNAVTRNRVKRRMRHLARSHVPDTPVGIDLVIRALPRAATVPADVAADLGSAWHEVVSRLASRRSDQEAGA